MSESQRGSDPNSVTLWVPANPEHVAVLRAATGVIASRLQFSLDDIDDLRILVDEAASVLLSAGASGQLRCVIETEDDAISFRLSAQLPDGQRPHGDGFAWSILKALAHKVSSESAPEEHVITVTRHRGPVLDPTG